jgi:undecaprenyl-diphosphatase
MSSQGPGHIDPDVEFGHLETTHRRFTVILLWWLAVSALLLAMSWGPARRTIESIDNWWLDLMVDHENDVLVALAEALAFTGSVFITSPLRVGVSIWLARRAAWAKLGVWLGSIFVGEVTLSVLKAVFGRERPSGDLALEVTRSSSFPSGHSIAAAATAVALVYVFAKAGTPARRWFYVAAVYAVAMAVSRNYLRVHWLSDVTIGLVIGVSSVMLSVWIVERFTVGISGALESVFGWAAKKER